MLKRRKTVLICLFLALMAPFLARAQMDAMPVPAAKVADAARSSRNTRRDRMNNISWSAERLWQVLVNEKLIDFRIYADGEKQIFKLNFGPTETGTGIMMTLQIGKASDQMQFMYTQEALDYLESIGVTHVRALNKERETVYEMEELRALLGGEAAATAAQKEDAPDAGAVAVLSDLPVQDDASIQGEDPAAEAP